MKKMLAIFAIIILILVLLVFNFGLGGNGGSGSGENTENKAQGTSTETTKDNVTTIEINKDKYLVNGETLSITKIEALLSNDSSTEFIVVDNYGSAKSWDELQELFFEYGKQYIEE